MESLANHPAQVGPPGVLPVRRRILILKCSDPSRWYSQSVGQVFDLLWRDRDGWWVRELDDIHLTNVVLPQDAELVP